MCIRDRVYTRKNDTFLTLQERADVANKAGGDLFISIHTNSVDRKSPNRKSVNGASTYTLGLHRTRENLEVAKRENSVILLEKDFSTRYEGFDPNSSESYIIFEFQQDKHMEQSVNFASDIQRQFRSVSYTHLDVYKRQGMWRKGKRKVIIFLLFSLSTFPVTVCHNTVFPLFCIILPIYRPVRDIYPGTI